MYSITKHIPKAVTSTVGRQLLKGQKHSPTILFVGGVVGIVAAGVMASKATLKLEEVIADGDDKLFMAESVIKQDRPDYTQEDYKRDVAIIYYRRVVGIAKLYGPSIAVAALSIAALTGSHYILTKRNLALMAAYATLDRSFNEYRQRVTDEYGEEAEEKFREAKLKENLKKKIEHDAGAKPGKAFNPSGYARFFDEYCDGWSKTPEYNLLTLKAKQNWANDLLKSRGHIFLNEVYDMLGIDRSSSGSVVGWVISKDGDNYVDFGIFNGKNPRVPDFVNGREAAILLDFNVDGVIYDKI